MKFVVATKSEFRVHHTDTSKKGCCNPFTKREDSLVRRDEGSTESEEQNDPDEQDLDENTDDDEDIEDEPTESYSMGDEWQ